MDYPASAQPANARLGLKMFGPQTYAGTEEVTVGGGTFLARKYVLRLPDGGETALWFDSGVYPTGIVKMQTVPPSHNPTDGVVMALVSRGNGARRQIVKPLRPFDGDAYRREQMAGLIGPPSTSRASN